MKASSEPRCSTCKGHGQDYTEEWDVVHKMVVTIHLDNGCKPCRGTGLLRGHPFVISGGGYSCKDACRLGVSLFVRAWRDSQGVRWAKYRCTTANHEWDKTVIRDVYAALAPRPVPDEQPRMEGV